MGFQGKAGLTKSASCLWYSLTLITYVTWTGILAFLMRVSRFLSKWLARNRHGWAFVRNNYKSARPLFTSRVGVGAYCSTEQLPGGGCMHSVETREAAEYGYISVCKMLVQHCAHLTLEDHQNETALAKAKKRAHSDIAAFLAEKLGMEEEAKYLAEGRFHTVYVCEREHFLQLPRLIKCDVARECGTVRELQPDDLNKRIAFTSHRWLRSYKTKDPSKEQKQRMEQSCHIIQKQGYTEEQAPMEPHPDDYENLKLKGFKYALQLGELIGVELIWMDYLCIPQDDLSAQLLAINTLSYTVRLCSDFVVLHNENTGIKNFHHQNLDEGSWEVYNSRGWCRLECLSASAPKESGEQIKKWKCSYSIEKVEIEPLNFPSVSVFNPYEGEFVDAKDMKRIALMVYKLGQRLADTYSNVDLAELMKAAYENMPNKEMQKRYEEDLKCFFR